MPRSKLRPTRHVLMLFMAVSAVSVSVTAVKSEAIAVDSSLLTHSLSNN